MIVRLAQLKVTKKIATNFDKIIKVLNNSEKDEWVIFPEGMLSGYYPSDNDFIKKIDFKEIFEDINKIVNLVKIKNCICILGTAYKEDNRIYNATLLITPNKTKTYFKNKLSKIEKIHFKPGNNISSYEETNLKIGIQMCREIVFPKQWTGFKKEGVKVVFHINNAVKLTDIFRKSSIISRAIENNLFICSVNNADKFQTLPSLVVSPAGRIIYQSKVKKETVTPIVVNLKEVKDSLDKILRIDPIDWLLCKLSS